MYIEKEGLLLNYFVSYKLSSTREGGRLHVTMSIPSFFNHITNTIRIYIFVFSLWTWTFKNLVYDQCVTVTLGSYQLDDYFNNAMIETININSK